MGPPTAPELGKVPPHRVRQPTSQPASPDCVFAHLQEGLKAYFKAKIEEAEIAVRNKTQNLRRLEAQRNELNTKGAWTSDTSGVCLWRG